MLISTSCIAECYVTDHGNIIHTHKVINSRGINQYVVGDCFEMLSAWGQLFEAWLALTISSVASRPIGCHGI